MWIIILIASFAISLAGRLMYRAGWRARLEVKLPDMWIGVFWKRTPFTVTTATGLSRQTTHTQTDIWICLLPCLPIHLRRSSGGIIIGTF